MPDPDYKALCAELHEALEKRCETLEEDRLLDRSAAALRAEAALARPEPVAPTDEELLGLYGVATPCYHIEEYRRELDYGRAVLARWGTPAIEPVSQS
jgi:hypothetical protein